MEEAFLAAKATLALGLSPSSSAGSNISALRGGVARVEAAPRRVRSNGCGLRRRWKTEERLFRFVRMEDRSREDGQGKRDEREFTTPLSQSCSSITRSTYCKVCQRSFVKFGQKFLTLPSCEALLSAATVSPGWSPTSSQTRSCLCTRLSPAAGSCSRASSPCSATSSASRWCSPSGNR